MIIIINTVYIFFSIYFVMVYWIGEKCEDETQILYQNYIYKEYVFFIPNYKSN